MAEQTHVLAAHLENHGDLIADPETPTDHLIATFPIEAFEVLWEPKGWVLVNRAGEAVETPAEADPDAEDTPAEEVDRAALRKERVQKFNRASKSGTSTRKASSASSSTTPEA